MVGGNFESQLSNFASTELIVQWVGVRKELKWDQDDTMFHFLLLNSRFRIYISIQNIETRVLKVLACTSESTHKYSVVNNSKFTTGIYEKATSAQNEMCSNKSTIFRLNRTLSTDKSYLKMILVVCFIPKLCSKNF